MWGNRKRERGDSVCKMSPAWEKTMSDRSDSAPLSPPILNYITYSSTQVYLADACIICIYAYMANMLLLLEDQITAVHTYLFFCNFKITMHFDNNYSKLSRCYMIFFIRDILFSTILTASFCFYLSTTLVLK